MAITLTNESLEYYILTRLSIQNMYGTQMLKNVPSTTIIQQTTFYNMLNKLEREGKITKTPVVQNGVQVDLCSITPFGKKCLNAFLQKR